MGPFPQRPVRCTPYRLIVDNLRIRTRMQAPVLFITCIYNLYESDVRLRLCFTENEQREFTKMVVAPHGAFAVGNFLAERNAVPAVGAMIDGMEKQALMFFA